MTAAPIRHRVAIVGDRYELGYGLTRGGPLRPVYDPTTGRPRITRGIGREVDLDACEIADLRDALTRQHPTDAYVVAYTVPGRERQPRLKKDGLEHLVDNRGWPMLTASVFFVDVDNTDHRPWSSLDEQREVLARLRALPVLARAGIYMTRRGYRIVQPLDRELSIIEFEDYLGAWLRLLLAAGIVVDDRCRDWTRLFAAPNHRRVVHDQAGRVLGRIDVVCGVFSFDAMAPIAPPDLARADAPRRPHARARAVSTPLKAPLQPMVWADTVPEEWTERVTAIADAVRDEGGNWHELFLALAGAMLERGVEPEIVPTLNRAISIATGVDTRTADRIAGAQTTVSRWRLHQNIQGAMALLVHWPAVAVALEQAVAQPAPLPPREDFRALLRDTIANAPQGVSGIQLDCGGGKTEAAIDVIVQRAARGLPTAYLAPTNALALQGYEELRNRGVPTARFFGPLSLLEADGVTPVCKKYDIAKHLVAGGYSMKYELCEGRGVEPCEHRDTCRAREGVEGDDRPLALVATHMLVTKVERPPLVLADEPPAPLVTEHVTVADLEHALSERQSFEGRYRTVMDIVVAALHAYMRTCTPEEPVNLHELIGRIEATLPPRELALARRAVEYGESGSLLECGRAAVGPEHNRRGPPTALVPFLIAKRTARGMEALGRAARVFGLIHSCLVATTPTIARVLEGGAGTRTLALTHANFEFVQALLEDRSSVLLDAGLEIQMPGYAKLLGYSPPLTKIAAGDGAPVTRVQIMTRGACRTKLFENGRLLITDRLVGMLDAGIRCALEASDTTCLGIISMLAVRLAIEGCLRPDDLDVERRWAEIGQSPATLELARTRLRPILAQWPGQILLGHYGALRGLNYMAGVDALITLGDPRPNLGDAWAEAMYLGLDNAEERADAYAAVELEQAHGRARTIHRTTPARLIHVGIVQPGGSGWSCGLIERRTLAGGRTRKGVVVPTDELRELVRVRGGRAVVAHALDVSTSALHAYLAGTRAMPELVFKRLLALNQAPS